ncbi:MAG: hypothetical protein WDW38_004786 [Sanguina aurantia]
MWPRGTTLAVILGGGETDQRLFPLTDSRALPAVPAAGSYRLIDFPMSSLISSGINKVIVLTQFKSQSLNKYVTQTYNLSSGVPYGGDGFVEVVAASQYPNQTPKWATGNADAVRNALFLFGLDSPQQRRVEDVMVLPADQIYRIDFTSMVTQHRRSGADVTILCHPCTEEETCRFGIVQLDPVNGAVLEYAEKPASDTARNPLRMLPSDIARLSAGADALSHNNTHLRPVRRKGQAAPTPRATAPKVPSTSTSAPEYLASTGIYLFRREVLSSLLEQFPAAKHFGADVLPIAIGQEVTLKDEWAGGSRGTLGPARLKVFGQVYSGVWSDVGGSIKDYYEAHMAMTTEEGAAFDPLHYRGTVFQSLNNVPPTANRGTRVVDCVVSGGCVLGERSRMQNSIVGKRSVIGNDCTITHSVLLGADYYEGEHVPQNRPNPVGDLPPLGIGAGSSITRAVIDKNARIGRGVVVANREGVYESFDRIAQGVCIRDGIVCLAKGAVLEDGAVV